MSKAIKALGDPTRRRILELLRVQAMSAGDLADRFVLSKSTMSGHFAVLRDAGLVEVQRQGTTLVYRLNTSVLEEALRVLLDGFGLKMSRTRHAIPAAEAEASSCAS